MEIAGADPLEDLITELLNLARGSDEFRSFVMRIPQLRPILYSATHRPVVRQLPRNTKSRIGLEEMCRFISGNLGAFQSSAPLDLMVERKSPRA